MMSLIAAQRSTTGSVARCRTREGENVDSFGEEATDGGHPGGSPDRRALRASASYPAL
jgi:hypothetical protein